MLPLAHAVSTAPNGLAFPGKIVIFRRPACFSQGAHNVQSPQSINKLAAICRMTALLGHKLSWRRVGGGGGAF